MLSACYKALILTLSHIGVVNEALYIGKSTSLSLFIHYRFGKTATNEHIFTVLSSRVVIMANTMGLVSKIDIPH